MAAESDSSSSSLGFKLLDDTNFSIWLPRMTDAIKKKKLWLYALGTEQKPEPDTTTIYTADATGKSNKAKATKAFNDELREWINNDGAAAALIRSGVTDSQMHHLDGCDTAHDSWTAIRTAHEKQGLNHALSYLNLLWSTRLAEGGKVQEHITTVKTAHDRLVAAGLGMHLSNEALAGILMFSFPPSYGPIAMTLSMLKREDFTFSAVSRAMLNEEQRRLTSASMPSLIGGGSEQSALAVHRPQQSQPKSAPCNWCGLNNHTEARCHRKVDGLPQRTPAEKQEAVQRAQQRGGRHRGGNDRKSPSNEANVAKPGDGGTTYLALSSADDIESDTALSQLAAAVTSSVARVAGPPQAQPAPHAVSLHSKGVGARARRDAMASDWYVDSGASYHYCRVRDWFETFTPVQGKTVKMGDGGAIPLLGRGIIRANVPISPDHTEAGTFTDVHYAPGLSVNLLSVAAMTAKGLSVLFDGRECIIRNKQKKIIGRAVQVTNRLYQLTLSLLPAPPVAATALTATPSTPRVTTAIKTAKPDSVFIRELLSLFHSRLGHASYDSVRKLFAQHMGKDTEKLLRGSVVKLTSSTSAPPCEGCHLGKSHRASLPKQSTTSSKAPLELVHMDLCGPFRVKSAGGARYWLLIVDDYCRYVYLHPMKEKSEAPAIFKAYKAYAELHFKEQGHLIKAVRVDGAGELNSREFTAYLKQLGITQQVTSAHTSEQNGIAERKHRVVAEHMRAMMLAWGPSHVVPVELWAECAVTSAYLLNRSLTSSLPGMTPHEAWHGVKPTYAHLRTIGCLAYVHTHRATRNDKGGLGKLGPQATRCAMIGYSETAKAYRLWDFQAKKVITSIHVSFEERQPAFTAGSATAATAPLGNVPPPVWEDLLPELIASELSHRFDDDDEDDDDDDDDVDDDVPKNDDMPVLIPPPAGLAPGSGPTAVVPPSAAADHSAREPSFLERVRAALNSEAAMPAMSTTSKAKSTFLRDVRAAMNSMDRALMAKSATPTISTTSTDDPTTYEEAVSRPDAHLWIKAMKAEVDSLCIAGTYDVTELPKGFDAIGGKWVYRTKRGPDGEIVKYKARWVAQGFRQKYGIDYHETFAPVARFDSIRALLSLVAHHDWELHQMDVKSAYLNGDLEEELYMKQPTGFVAAGAEKLVCRLNKSLYGLKQAGRTWNKRMDVELKAHGFVPIHADPCVYAYKRGNVVLIISLYVDDLLLASDNLEELKKVKAELQSCFEMEDMGEASFALGIKITRDRAARTLTISQGAYILDVLTRFNMQDLRPVSTPMDPKPKHKSDTAPTEQLLDDAGKKRYQSAVGALLHAARATRPDISYAVTSLSQFCKAPTDQHWLAIRRVFRYLRGSVDHGLTYRGSGSLKEPPTLFGYCDSDYAEDKNDRRSVTGYAFILSGAAISWVSRKQATVAHSTVQAEYMAASDAAKEAIWWRMFLSALGYPMDHATTILSDNQGSITNSKNPEDHRNMKHIEVRHHYIREQVAAGNINLEYISTSQMAADVLTKPVAAIQHDRTCKLLGMTNPSP
jgi:transposase InsO family protein